jgi:hypothetical protein
MMSAAFAYAEMNLSRTMHWVDITLHGAAVVKVAGRLSGEGREIDGAVLLVAEFAPPIGSKDELADSGLYLSEEFGPFAYIQTHGSQEGSFLVSFKSPGGRALHRIGMRLWRCEGPLRLSDFTVAVSAPASSKNAATRPELPADALRSLVPPKAIGHITPELLHLWRARFRDVPLYCADELCIGRDAPESGGDWTSFDTTPDQRRIEEHLRAKCHSTSTVLHVGVGNSRLAQSFSGSVGTIVGITIQRGELEHALQCDLPNYFPFLLNKFSMEFFAAFPGRFDFIVDNNPTSFCCCFLHFSRMMSAYRSLLSDQGRIITDRVGLAWVLPNISPRWSCDFADWSKIAEALGMSVKDEDGSVYTTKLMANR